MATNQGVAEAEALISDQESPESERPMRADARRNRELLVAAAREVFAEQGVSASMEAIARKAGVGVGTLYRHFPTRLDVVEAVYEDDVEELTDAAQRLVSTLEPGPAVNAFFDAFLHYAQTKRTLLTELRQAFEKNPAFRSRNRERIDAAFDLVIDRAKNAGAIRDDVSGSDITKLLGPICTNESLSTDQTKRLMGMILDGLRVMS
ncbi:MAG TPA: helix-turn-helix domain-containing protein [Acidimicrobiales bacterium]